MHIILQWWLKAGWEEPNKHRNQSVVLWIVTINCFFGIFHTHDKTKLLSPAPLHLLIIFMPNPCLRGGGSLMLGLVVFGEQIYISQHPHVKTINYFVMILSSLTDDFWPSSLLHWYVHVYVWPDCWCNMQHSTNFFGKITDLVQQERVHCSVM